MATSARTQRRDKQRSLEQLNVLAAARYAAQGAKLYPRFEDVFNKAMGFMLAQNQSSKVKQGHIIRTLKPGPQELNEICTAINLDRVSCKTELRCLMARNVVEMRDRDGHPIVLRANGRPTRTPVYRLGPGHPASNTTAADVSQNAGALGPSRRSARHG